MDEQTAHGLILENMVMAKRIAQKYAHRNARHEDETIAEAYYCLTTFFLVDFKLYEKSAPEYKRTLGVYIKRNLIKYFERKVKRFDPEQDKVVLNMDEEMIEYLSDIMPEENAFKLFRHLRDGIDMADVDLLDPVFRKTLKKIRLKVTGRLKRIEELKAAGIAVSREVKYASQVEDEGSEAGAADDHSGDGRGIPNPGTAQGEPDQPQVAPAARHEGKAEHADFARIAA